MTAITMFFALFGGMVHAFRKKARMLREEMGSKKQQVRVGYKLKPNNSIPQLANLTLNVDIL